MKAVLCKTGSSVKHEVREGGREGGGEEERTVHVLE